MRRRSALATRKPVEVPDNSMAETGGFISSIPALERAESLGPDLMALIRDVVKLDCVSDDAKRRLNAILARHSQS